MSNYKLLYVICRSALEARKLGKILVKDKLVACTNIISNIHSIFNWNGKIGTNKEILLLGKTQKKNVKKIIKTIKSNHSYECPAILFFNVETGSGDFLKWIKQNS